MTQAIQTADFAFLEVSVSRVALGLTDLNLNDHVAYITGDQIMGGTQTWNRQTAKSPYVDGEFLVNANRGLVQDRFAVQVLGQSQSQLNGRLADLVEAFSQPSYILHVTLEDGNHDYVCQPADYAVDWSRERWMARKVLVSFTLPRQPVLKIARTV